MTIHMKKRFTMQIKYYPIIICAFIMCMISCSQGQTARYQKTVDSLDKVNNAQEITISRLTDSLQSVMSELEGYRYLPERLLADAKDAYQQRKPHLFAKLIAQMKQYHPQAKELEQIETLHTKLANEINEEKAAEEAKRMKAVNILKKKYDDISGITWYETKAFTHYNNSNLTSLYIGKTSYPWLRLRMSYTGSDWIFFEQAYLSYSGRTYEITFDRYKDKKTENSGGYVWEWIDVSVPSSLLSFIQDAVKDGGPIKMRLSGKYTKTRVLSSKEVQALKDVLLAYDV